jgi:glucose-6-phosphate-specific signal transduction histidine kinase
MRPIMLFGLNLILVIASWVAYTLPRGDEYLFLFIIPIVYVLMPFIFSARQAAAITSMNFMFLLFYWNRGILNPIDIAVFMAVFILVGLVSYLASGLYGMFSSLYEEESSAARRKYNSLVSELEAIDKRGKK